MRSLFVALRTAARMQRVGELAGVSVAAALGVALFAPVAMAADAGTGATDSKT
jgi:hypothetical protein